MQEKDVNEMTLEELRRLELFGQTAKFNAIVIVPMEELHDSGYRCMKFVLTSKGKIVGVVSGWSDVMHINGIGGYGRDYMEALKTGMVPVFGWSIDCLPVSGCVRLFVDRSATCSCDHFIGSDFQFYAERGK